MIGSLNEFHLPQIVIAAIVAGVALGIRDGSREHVDIPGFPTLSYRAEGNDRQHNLFEPCICLAFTRWAALIWQVRQFSANFWMTGFSPCGV